MYFNKTEYESGDYLEVKVGYVLHLCSVKELLPILVTTV